VKYALTDKAKLLANPAVFVPVKRANIPCISVTIISDLLLYGEARPLSAYSLDGLLRSEDTERK
jgi:hypothetical protein